MGVVRHVVGVPGDRQLSAVITADRLGDPLQGVVRLRGELGRVDGEGDVAGHVDGGLVPRGQSAGGAVQGDGVALDGHRVAQGVLGTRLGDGRDDVQLGRSGVVGIDDGDLDEASVRQEDRHRVGVDRAEGRVEGQTPAGADGVEGGLRNRGRPDARALGIDQTQGSVGAEGGGSPAEHDGGDVERRSGTVLGAGDVEGKYRQVGSPVRDPHERPDDDGERLTGRDHLGVDRGLRGGGRGGGRRRCRRVDGRPSPVAGDEAAGRDQRRQ